MDSGIRAVPKPSLRDKVTVSALGAAVLLIAASPWQEGEPTPGILLLGEVELRERTFTWWKEQSTLNQEHFLLTTVV